jgi:hypothetical protein
VIAKLGESQPRVPGNPFLTFGCFGIFLASFTKRNTFWLVRVPQNLISTKMFNLAKVSS